MTIEALLEPTNYRPEESLSRYHRARAEWDDRQGHLIKQARNWRVTGLISLSAVLLLTAGLIYVASTRVVAPYVVTVKSETGEPRIVGKLPHITYEPRIEEIKYFLAQLVKNVRSIPSDPVLVRDNWLNSYPFLRPEAANLLNEITNSDPNSPLKKIGQQTVTIQLISINQVGNGASYQVRWEERVFTDMGLLKETYTMSAVFAVEIEVPRDEKELLKNPLGLYVSSFQWGREVK